MVRRIIRWILRDELERIEQLQVRLAREAYFAGLEDAFEIATSTTKFMDPGIGHVLERSREDIVASWRANALWPMTRVYEKAGGQAHAR